MIDRLLALFVEFDVRASWLVVGHLFLDRCQAPRHPGIVRPAHSWHPDDWFRHDPGRRGERARLPGPQPGRARARLSGTAGDRRTFVLPRDLRRSRLLRAAAESDLDALIAAAAQMGLTLRSSVPAQPGRPRGRAVRARLPRVPLAGADRVPRPARGGAPPRGAPPRRAAGAHAAGCAARAARGRPGRGARLHDLFPMHGPRRLRAGLAARRSGLPGPALRGARGPRSSTCGPIPRTWRRTARPCSRAAYHTVRDGGAARAGPDGGAHAGRSWRRSHDRVRAAAVPGWRSACGSCWRSCCTSSWMRPCSPRTRAPTTTLRAGLARYWSGETCSSSRPRCWAPGRTRTTTWWARSTGRWASGRCCPSC